MADSRPRGDRMFLIAAVLLPLVVVALFLLATAIPRWTVPLPAYDLILRTTRAYDRSRPHVAVDVSVKDGRVEGAARLLPADSYADTPVLFLYDHSTQAVREIAVTLPDPPPDGAAARTFAIDVAPGRRVVSLDRAPDGYAIASRESRGPGIIGDIFGMNHYEAGVMLINRGRTVPVRLPPPYDTTYGVYPVGWVMNEGR